MSVECGLYIADWDEITGALDDGKEPGELVDGWHDCEIPIEMAQAQDEFLAALERMEGAIPPSRLEPLNRLFSSLFWSWKDSILRIVDAGTGAEEGLESLWSPETVARFAADADLGAVEDIEQAFSDRVGRSHYFDGPTEFVEYLKAWCAGIRLAAEQERAIVVFVFG